MSFRPNYDNRYLNESENLADLENVVTARTNLGLVAGGTGDIWVEKAGDTMTGQLAFDGVATDITTVTNQDLTFKPDGSGTMQVLSGSGGVEITTEAGNSDISLTPHGTGDINLNTSLKVRPDGSGVGNTSIGVIEWARGTRLYEQGGGADPERFFFLANGDRYEVLSEDGGTFLFSANGANSAQPDRFITFGGICSGNYAASAPPSNGAIFGGDVGLGTNAPATQVHIKMVSNTDWTIEGNNNFGSNTWKKANGTTMGFMGYSNTGGYITGSINGGMHMRATNGWTFGHGATLLFTADNTDGLKIGAKRVQQTQGANVAAANDLTLGSDGNVFTITGNTQINAITTTNWQNGSDIILKFTGTPTVKHNTAGGAGTAVLMLSGSADLVAANDTILRLTLIDGEWQESGRKIA